GRTTALGWSPGGLRARARRPTGHHPRPHGRRVGSPPFTPRGRAAGCPAGHLPESGHVASGSAGSIDALPSGSRAAGCSAGHPRTWREMTWSERWRWLRLRTTGSERLTDRDLKATDQLKAVLECMKEEAGFGKPTAPTARPGDGAESKIIRW